MSQNFLSKTEEISSRFLIKEGPFFSPGFTNNKLYFLSNIFILH